MGCDVLFRKQATQVAFVGVAEGFSPAGGCVGALGVRLAPEGAGYGNEACLRRLIPRENTLHPGGRSQEIAD